MAAVLIVEDEKHLANGLKFNLEADGYRVDIVSDGEAAISALAPDHPYDAVILDVMLPGKSGFDVAAELRARGEFVPVLMLTARGRPEDVLRGFESGADDYLPKPFELAILMARLRGLLRRREWIAAGVHKSPDRSGVQQEEVFSFGDKRIDFGRLELQAGGRTVCLTAMEVELLRYMVRHEGKAVSRKAMLEDLWGLHEDTDTRAIDNFIVRLRKYLEDEPAHPKHLLTVRGVGYRFVASPPTR